VDHCVQTQEEVREAMELVLIALMLIVIGTPPGGEE
jgi:hypothetical protein